MWPEKGACILLDETFDLGFALVTYDSELDNGHYAISFGYGLLTIVTTHGLPRTALPAN